MHLKNHEILIITQVIFVCQDIKRECPKQGLQLRFLNQEQTITIHWKEMLVEY